MKNPFKKQKKLKVLNLYAGIGGNRWHWPDTEVEVTAVESEQYIADAYQQFFPNDTVIVGDAHQYLIDHYQEFDFIWSSPPCPTHSKMSVVNVARGRRKYPDMALYQEIIWLKHFYKGKFVVENVVPFYKSLIEPTVVIDRHNFWANFDIEPKDFPRNYGANAVVGHNIGGVTGQTKETLANAYGIQLPSTVKNQRKLLRNAVMPVVGDYVYKQLKGEK